MTIQTEKSKESTRSRKSKIGRPTKYGPEIPASLETYLKDCQDLLVGRHLRVNLPTVEGFALLLGVHRDTLYQWSKEHPEFSDTLGRLKAEQFTRLVNNGLAGNYSSVITKLLLVTNHGMKEVKEEGHECFSLLRLSKEVGVMEKTT